MSLGYKSHPHIQYKHVLTDRKFDNLHDFTYTILTHSTNKHKYSFTALTEQFM